MEEYNNVSDDELKNMNFSKISYSYRENLAEDLYYYILPSIYDAIIKGKPFLSIKDRVRELKSVSDLVSDMLIKNNNVYRVFSTNTEFTVEIIPIKNSLRYDYTNRNFNRNLIDSDDEVDINFEEENQQFNYSINNTSLEIEDDIINNDDLSHEDINNDYIPVTRVILNTNSNINV